MPRLSPDPEPKFVSLKIDPPETAPMEQSNAEPRYPTLYLHDVEIGLGEKMIGRPFKAEIKAVLKGLSTNTHDGKMTFSHDLEIQAIRILD